MEIPFLFMSDQPEVGANLIVPIQTGHVGMIKTTRLGCRIVELVAERINRQSYSILPN